MSNIIHTRLVKIGNSQGIRIPKAVLDQLGLADSVELEVQEGQLVVRNSKTPRAGWAAHFQQMAERGDDRLLHADSNQTTWDETDWQW